MATALRKLFKIFAIKFIVYGDVSTTGYTTNGGVEFTCLSKKDGGIFYHKTSISVM